MGNSTGCDMPGPVTCTDTHPKTVGNELFAMSPKPTPRVRPEVWNPRPKILIIALEENGGWKVAPFTAVCNVGLFPRLQAPTAEIVLKKVYTRSPAAVPSPSAATTAM